jgi:hypothetical protein
MNNNIEPELEEEEYLNILNLRFLKGKHPFANW